MIIPESFTGKGVAQLLKKRTDLHGKKAVVIRPVEGIDTAVKELSSHFSIQAVPVYKTVINIPDNKEEVEKLLQKNEIFAVIFTSPSTFKNFTKIFENWRELLKNTKKAVIGSTTAKAVRQENIQPDVIPEKYTIEELIKALKQLI